MFPEAIIEEAAVKEETMIIWLEDFGFPMEIIEDIKAETIMWFTMQNINCHFNAGKGR